MNFTSTVRAVAGGLMLGAALTVGSSAALAQGEPFRIVITEQTTPLVINSAIILAEELGYFDAEGVNVELVRVGDTPTAVDVLSSGNGEMANIATDAALLLIANNVLDIRAVQSPDRFLPFQIEASDDITDVSQLAGKSFGVARVGSLDYNLSTMVLRALGVDPATVNFVEIGAPAVRAEALLNGDIDATSTSIGIWLSQPDTAGHHILVPVEDYGVNAPVVNKVNVVTTETLENRRDDVEAVTRAIIKLERDFNADPTKWVDAMMASVPDANRETLETLAATFQGTWATNGGLNAHELDFSVAQIFAGPDFAGLTAPAMDAWVDHSIIDDILAELGMDDTTTDMEAGGAM